MDTSHLGRDNLQIRSNYVVEPVNGFRPVCRNRHAMIHRRFRNILSKNSEDCYFGQADGRIPLRQR
jgi:hypothetical protein